MKNGKGILDILLIVLDENNGFSFYQEVEPIFRPLDLQHSIDDQDDEKNTGKDSKVEGREASLDLIPLLIENRPHAYSGLTPS